MGECLIQTSSHNLKDDVENGIDRLGHILTGCCCFLCIKKNKKKRDQQEQHEQQEQQEQQEQLRLLVVTQQNLF
jgi:large-conductance mechanosensitive channel